MDSLESTDEQWRLAFITAGPGARTEVDTVTEVRNGVQMTFPRADGARRLVDANGRVLAWQRLAAAG